MSPFANPFRKYKRHEIIRLKKPATNGSIRYARLDISAKLALSTAVILLLFGLIFKQPYSYVIYFFGFLFFLVSVMEKIKSEELMSAINPKKKGGKK